MKLLILTQVVDTEHPILGFFHRWIAEFAAQCEHVHVICLYEGTHSLPSNVTVHSLGKEAGKGRLTYLWRFYKLSWQLRHDYDNVFVHMNQIYVNLGAPLWRLSGKKVGLWYAHGAVSASLWLATKLTNIVFTSTAEGCRIHTTKKKLVGQGIDLALFTAVPKVASRTLRLVTVGRIAPSKNIDTLLHACALLKQQTTDFTFSIIGTSLTEQEAAYEQKMRTLVSTLGLVDQVVWVGGRPQAELPQLLQSATVFIHDGATNSLDKTLLEALLCGCVVTSSNPAYRAIAESISPDLLFDPRDAARLGAILVSHASAVATGTYSDTPVQALQTYVKNNFSVQHLISGIITIY